MKEALQELLSQINSISLTLKKIEKSLEKPRKNNLPIVIAMIGLFGSILGYFFTEYSKNKMLDKQTEYNFIDKAISESRSGKEKKSKLLFLVNSGLIPVNKAKILEKLNTAITTPEGDLIFLDEDAKVIGANNLWLLGITLNDDKKYLDAIKVLSKAIEIDSTYYWAYISLSYSYLQIDKYEKVIETCDKAVKINPRNYNAFFNRGNAFYYLDKKERACKEWEDALYLIQDKNSPSAIQLREYIEKSCNK